MYTGEKGARQSTVPLLLFSKGQGGKPLSSEGISTPWNPGGMCTYACAT